MKTKFLTLIAFLFTGWNISNVICQEIDVELYDSLCPGFKNRYAILNECKIAPLEDIDQTILRLNNVINQIENSPGLIDDVNYFEAVFLMCSAYINKGDYVRIDSTLYSAGKFIIENGLDENGYLYKYNRAAAWVEFHAGRYDSALELLLQVRKDYEAKEDDIITYVALLQDISLCYLSLGEIESFKQAAQESLQFSDKLPVNDNTIQMKIQAERIEAYLSVFDGYFDKGVSMLEDLSSRLNNNGAFSRNRLSVLDDLAALYLYNNQIDKYIETKQNILENKSLSIEERISVLESLFGAEWLYGSDKDIIEHAIMHSETLKAMAISEVSMFSPTKRIWQWPEIKESINKDSYVLTRYPHNEDVCVLCYNNALFIKNMLFSSDYLIRKYVYTNPTTNHIAQLKEIDSIRSFIMYDAIDEKYGDSYSYELSYRESDLMNGMPLESFAKEQIVTWKNVQNFLNEDEAAIEVVDCAIPFAEDSVYSQLMALIVTKYSEYPECINLGNYYDMYDELRSVFSKEPLEISSVYSKRNSSIYKCTFGRLKDKLSNVKTIYFSSNTLLSLVNLGAILLPDGNLASEQWDIRMLSSTAEIIHFNNRLDPISSISLFGGGNFSSNDTIGIGGLYAEVVRDISTRGDFQELKGAIKEVETIGSLFEKRHVHSSLYTGANATERAFRSMDGLPPQIIHVATHCFSITNIVDNPYLSRLMAIDSNEAAMIGTGFILSGANTAWNLNARINPIEDGVLLSEDISRLNLNGCELIVLSGCQSGEGKMSQDGVIGLQRALKRAGVKSMLVSLWNVNDETTKEFMVAFYDNLLMLGDKHEAYRAAQIQIKKRYNDPFYWAPFILID